MSIEHYSVYRLSDGAFTGQQIGIPDVAPDEHKRHALSAIPTGHAVKFGRFDHLSQRVDITAEGHPVIDWRPEQPSPEHEWAVTRRWTLSAAAQERRQRQAEALARIAALEAAQHRAVREILLKVAPDEAKRLAEIEMEIAKLRHLIA